MPVTLPFISVAQFFVQETMKIVHFEANKKVAITTEITVTIKMTATYWKSSLILHEPHLQG